MAPLRQPETGPPPNPLGRRGRWLATVLVALVVNLPVVQGWWADRQLAADGVTVRAEVVDSVLLDSRQEARPVVAFELPRPEGDGRAAGTRWAVEVDETTYDEAQETGLLEVRVLPGRPGVFEVPGAVRSHVGLVLTLAVDAVLVVLLVVARRRRRAEAARSAGDDAGAGPRPRGEAGDVPAAPAAGPLSGTADPGGPASPASPDRTGSTGTVRLGARGGARLVAEDDLTPRGPGAAYQPHPDGSVELRGPLLGIRDDEVLLEVDGARVVVSLDGHRLGPLRLGDAAQVRVRPRG